MDKLVDLLIRNYPKKILLDDKREVIFRPLRKDDEKGLADFFGNLPLKDRICLKEDVAKPEVIESWVLNLDYDNVLPIVAFDDGRIVGDATLHFSPIGWTKHQGEIRIAADVDYRARGLGRRLTMDIINIAQELGLEQLSIEVSPAMHEALFLCQKLGFKQAASLKGFIIDFEGNETDLILMIKQLNE